MNTNIQWVLGFIEAANEILTAAISIASFSLLLFSLFFIRKEKLARVFSLILLCLTVIYSADALSSTVLFIRNQLFWQQVHWSGILFLPAILYHFSETLLQMTGVTPRRLRRYLLWLVYVVSIGFLLLLWEGKLFSGVKKIENVGITMIPSEFSVWFWIWFGVLLVITLLNYRYTYHRTRTRTSRRRMVYLIVSSLGILLGTFPLLIFGSGFISEHTLFFWLISALANLVILLMVFLLGYSVITFCVSWSYRVVRLRLLEWVLRGPVTATATLGIVTLIRRSSNAFSINVGGWTSLITVVSIVVLEFLVTLLMPLAERNSFSGYGAEDYQMVTGLENMMIFSAELITYLESIISALCDQFQAKGAFVAAIDPFGNVEEFTHVGEAEWENIAELSSRFYGGERLSEEPILDDSGILLPVYYHDLTSNQSHLLAIIGITGPAAENFDEDNQSTLAVAADRLRIVLWQRWYLSRTFSVLKQLSQDENFSSYRKVGLLNSAEMLHQPSNLDIGDVSVWVRDALTHYWGGPRLTENPLIQLEVVQREMQGDNNNATNALRSVLRRAIDHIRPAGERSISGEWTLYNILELKFIEGLKVKEVAQKLAISEADLYRKQKVAIEEIAKTIIRMEQNEEPPEF